MKSTNAIKTYRKSGVAQGRDLRRAIRVPHTYRSISTLSLVSLRESASQIYRIYKGLYDAEFDDSPKPGQPGTRDPPTAGRLSTPSVTRHSSL